MKKADNSTAYSDVFSCARHLITLSLRDTSFPRVAIDFFSYIETHDAIKDNIAAFASPLDTTVLKLNISTMAVSDLESSPLSARILKFIFESALCIIFLHDTSLASSDKLSLVETALKNNPDNFYLFATYQKTKTAFHNMFLSNFSIIERTDSDILTPVLNYIPKINRPKTLLAHLSYLSITRADFLNHICMPNKLCEKDEIVCMDTFLKFSAVYAKMEKWRGPELDALIHTVYAMIKKLQREDLNFIKDKFTSICGKEMNRSFWNTFENASHVRAILNYIDEFLTISEIKELCDFCLFFLSLVIWYGDARLLRETIKRKMIKFNHKYKDTTLLSKMALLPLSIDFAFVQDQKGAYTAVSNEHHAILRTLKNANPKTEIQPLIGSLIWARDAFAWLDDDFRSYLECTNSTTFAHVNRGLISEGGNIVTGTARRNFLLVSREAVNGELATTSLYLEAKKRSIDVYILPGGFTWTRNPSTGEDIVLDSMHLDTVINIVPGDCIVTKKSKVIVDPYYYQMIRESREFQRFKNEQNISDDDIVIIDKKEAYLNLANFSIIFDQKKNKRLFFNKDAGLTLPRLQLKPNTLIQPDREITRLSSLNGSLRCVTNMSPQTHVKRGSSVLVSIEHTVPQDIEKKIMDLFLSKDYLIKMLSGAWIFNVQIQHRFQESIYEYDSLSRLACITIGHERGYDADASCRYIELSIKELCKLLNEDMGIQKRSLREYTVVPLSLRMARNRTDHFIKTRSGKLLKFDDRKKQLVSV